MSQQPEKQRSTLPTPPLTSQSVGVEDSQETYASTLEERARAKAKAERKFYEKLFAYLGIVAISFVVNIATGSGWWFYWTAIGLGIALLFDAIRTFGPSNRFDDDWENRKTQKLLSKEQGGLAPPADRSVPPAAPMAGLIDRGTSIVSTMRADAVQMTKPDVQAQALRICSRSDQILKVLAEPGRDEQLGREFVDQVLPTAQTVFSTYARLSVRQIASAQSALARVETNDLPLIERTLNDIYEQLHRHDVVSLEVASEMLELGKPGNMNY